MIVGLSVGIIVLAFTGPGTRTPGVGNPDFWIKSGNDVYYNITGGFVGVGTVGPAYKLDVQGGQINTSGGLCIAGDCKTAWSQVAGTNHWTLSGSNLYPNQTSYNVGVGTASPDINYKITTAGGGIKAVSNIANQPAGYFDNPSGYSLITGSGNVGIGKTPGSYALDVNGNVNATAYYGSGANLTGITVADNSITTAKLKTATGEVSGSPGGNLVLPGGEYGFYPQIKLVGGSNLNATLAGLVNNVNGINAGTGYITSIMVWNNGGGTSYAQQRYVTASGEDMWIFLLVDITKEIIGAYQAPDHPAYGNGGDFDKLPHPFVDYDSHTQEIVLIEKDQAKAIHKETQEKNLDVLGFIDSEYKIDFEHTYDYKPIHSGQFLETQPVLVKHIPDYIQVRKFVEMTDADKQAQKALKEEKQRQYEQEKQIKEQRHQEAVNKLKAIGLTEEELKEIIKYR